MCTSVPTAAVGVKTQESIECQEYFIVRDYRTVTKSIVDKSLSDNAQLHYSGLYLSERDHFRPQSAGYKTIECGIITLTDQEETFLKSITTKAQVRKKNTIVRWSVQVGLLQPELVPQ